MHTLHHKQSKVQKPALNPEKVSRFVENGVKRLNKFDPQWARKVNLNKLKISHWEYCVVGQVCKNPDYWNGLSSLNIFDVQAEEKNGFYIYGEEKLTAGEETIAWDLLRKTWKEAIKRERLKF